MKKLLFSIMALLAVAGTPKAQNALNVADITLPQNGEAMLTVSFQLDAADTYTGYSFNLQLPSGLEFVMESGTDVAYTKGPCHDSSHSVTANLDDGVVKVAGLSLGSKPLIGTEGVLLTFTVRPTTTLPIGQTLTGTISDILIVPIEGLKQSLASSNFTITISEPDDDRIHFDENATTLPAYTAGEKGNVTMKRTIKAGEWSTLVLPFNLTKAKAETVFGSDVQFAKFDSFVVNYGDDEENVTPLGITIKLTNYSIPARGNLAGGTPVLIKTSNNISEIQLDDVTLTDAVVTDALGNDVEDGYTIEGKLTGTFVKTVIPDDGLFINSNKFWYSKGATNVKAFRCWFELGAVLGEETDFGARVMLHFSDGETDDIQDMDADIHKVSPYNHAVYDLQGRKVDVNVNVKKGLYIRNGIKEIVK